MASCNHDGCERDSESCCFDCSLTFCDAHSSWCPSCWNTVCLGCKPLFHSGLTPTAHDHWSCGGWPMESLAQRTEFLARLLKIKNLRDLFIAFVKRRPFVFERSKIYVAITAQQRGDFHKFKWSIASNKHLVALLPLNATYDPAWLTDIIERARALDIMASGQWEFVHSTLFASKRRRDANPDEVFKLSGFDSQAFRARKIGLVDLDDPEEARALFAQWSLENGEKIYEINSLVPLYNSELTRKARGEALSSVMVFGSRPLDPAHQLIGLLAHQVMRNNVVVLWGSRTGGSVSKLDLEQPAREYRHKTGKGLVRLISATLRGRKVRILAGDPLTAVDADIDLTCMWDAKIMKQRFNIEYGFSRLEQEYVFYHLAGIADNTLHIGMQSGNIETLINNPRTNVICVNENTKGGAGLVNVDKISAKRDEQVRKGGPPCNLYLSYNLAVLPSALGQLTRMLMEKYGEMITLKHGLERLQDEINRKKPPTPSPTVVIVQPLDAQPTPPEPLPSSQLSLQPSSNPLSPPSSSPVVASPGKPAGKPGLLRTSSDDEMAERLMLYLAGKRAKTTELGPVTKSEIVSRPISQDLRIEIQMLLALAVSASQRVQYAIRCLNNVRLAPTRSPAELWLHVIAERVMQCPLYKLEKSQSDGEKGALSTAPRERARVLLEQMATTIALLKQKSVEDRPKLFAQYEKEYADLKHAFDHVDDDEPKRLKLSARHMSELNRDRSSSIQAEWQKLLHCQPWQPAELEEMVPICVLLGIDPTSSKGKRPPKNDDDDSSDGKPGDGKPGSGKPGSGKPGDGKPGDGKPGDGKPGNGAPSGRHFEPRFLPSKSGQVYPLDYGLPGFANRIVSPEQIAQWYTGFQTRPPSRQLYEELERTITHLDWQIAEQEPDRDERAEFTHATYAARGRNQAAYQTWLRFKELIALRDHIFH